MNISRRDVLAVLIGLGIIGGVTGIRHLLIHHSRVGALVILPIVIFAAVFAAWILGRGVLGMVVGE